ncbi:Long-chain-fatty-acid--CoA ligase 1 [Trichinella pseudospiralis]|uniref:long-chain-fatty-acid--CoA ligase n=1 Tax=Trichinella pseudospiralis TaxID=6337 RepID=A0A0V1FQV0_TRIPS|nr:Long-chain-fatty-acid--CoA ligase 1 [Trichinella pseudospiralis]KRZ43760.1 Long-chain-fatty-acid--CoA ligase 1 [Trichinella pseudospiralis]
MQRATKRCFFLIIYFCSVIFPNNSETYRHVDEVKQMLRNVKTYNEFLSRFHVLGLKNGTKTISSNWTEKMWSPHVGTIFTSVTSSLNSFRLIETKATDNDENVNPITGDVGEVIHEPIQSRDSCKVVTLCVPIPLEKQPTVYYFPECIDLPQCLGGCCDNFHRCQPVTTEPVRVKVRSWLYLGLDNGKPIFQLWQEFFVRLERHTSCDCNGCQKTPKCKENQNLVDCECRCVNEQDSQLCNNETQRWSEENCFCECINENCPDGSNLNHATCRCDKNPFTEELKSTRWHSFPQRRIGIRSLLKMSYENSLWPVVIVSALLAYWIYRTVWIRGNLKSKYSRKCQSIVLPGQERIHRSIMEGTCPDASVKTMLDIFMRGMEISNNGPCVGYRPVNSAGIGDYKWLNYGEVLLKAKLLASSLLNFKITDPEQNSVVGIYGINCPEWIVSSLAVTLTSSTIVPLYETFGHEAITRAILETQMSCIICDKLEKIQVLLRTKGRSAWALKHVILFDREGTIPSEQVQQIANDHSLQLHSMQMLTKLTNNNDNLNFNLPNNNDLYMIAYTSGSTGSPKGTLITHSSMVNSVHNIFTFLQSQDDQIFKNQHRLISYLPMAHVYEQLNQALCFYIGAAVGFYSGDVRQLLDDIRTLQPNWLPTVPRLLNRFHDCILANLQNHHCKWILFRLAIAWKRLQFKFGITDHHQHYNPSNNGLLDWLIFDQIKKKILGGKVQICVSGSAPVTAEVLTTCRAMFGCVIIESYGQTETVGPVAATLIDETEAGHVGALVPNVEVKLIDVEELNYHAKDDCGEICVRSNTLTSGYFRDAEQTKALIDQNGWLHTGDIGQWLPNGALKIIDRRKHIFKLSQGEFVAPERIENIYQRCPVICQIFVHGDSRQSYLVAVVVPQKEALISWAVEKDIFQQRQPTDRCFDLLCESRAAEQYILREMSKCAQLHGLNSLEQVKKIHLSKEMFTTENGLLTPTMKNQRNSLKQAYAAIIEQLYARD